MKTTLTFEVEYDESETSADAVTDALASLFANALDTEGVLDSCGPVSVDLIAPPPNARLIAAAPDLLDALQVLVEYADNGTPVHPGSLDWEQVRAAIARATGDES